MANLARPFALTSWRYQRVSTAAYNAADPSGGTEIAGQVAAFGTTLNTDAYSPPLYTVTSGAPKQRIGWWDSQVPGSAKTYSCPGVAALLDRMTAVPMPDDLSAAAGTDGAAVIWQPSTDTAWELWRLRPNDPNIWNPTQPNLAPYADPYKNVPGDQWQITWGGRIDNVSTNPTTSFRLDTDPAANGATFGHGVSASGMSLLAGVITASELTGTGGIVKAIDISLPYTAKRTTLTPDDGLSWPGYRSDGRLRLDQPSPYGGTVLREGQRLVMDRSVDPTGLHPVAAAIVKGMQNYGCIIRDTAGAVVACAQNPLAMSSDPYATLIGSTPKSAIMRQIPWDRLRALPKDSGKPA